MTIIQAITEILKDTAAVAGALSGLCTALSHFPKIPGRLQAIFARFGVATQKFAVIKIPGTP